MYVAETNGWLVIATDFKYLTSDYANRTRFFTDYIEILKMNYSYLLYNILKLENHLHLFEC